MLRSKIQSPEDVCERVTSDVFQLLAKYRYFTNNLRSECKGVCGY
jgi:hypothetical protein